MGMILKLIIRIAFPSGHSDRGFRRSVEVVQRDLQLLEENLRQLRTQYFSAAADALQRLTLPDTRFLK